MSMNILTLHRDPRNFSPFTDEFWPERWLIAQGSMELPSSIPKTGFVHNSAAFIPFSYGETLCFGIGGEVADACLLRAGPANCVGKPLAILGRRSPQRTLDSH